MSRIVVLVGFSVMMPLFLVNQILTYQGAAQSFATSKEKDYLEICLEETTIMDSYRDSFSHRHYLS